MFTVKEVLGLFKDTQHVAVETLLDSSAGTRMTISGRCKYLIADGCCGNAECEVVRIEIDMDDAIPVILFKKRSDLEEMR